MLKQNFFHVENKVMPIIFTNWQIGFSSFLPTVLYRYWKFEWTGSQRDGSVENEVLYLEKARWLLKYEQVLSNRDVYIWGESKSNANA